MCDSANCDCCRIARRLLAQKQTMIERLVGEVERLKGIVADQHREMRLLVWHPESGRPS